MMKRELASHGKEGIILGVNQVMRSLERGLISLVFVSGYVTHI